jgi:PAS domain S-box-containing protein
MHVPKGREMRQVYPRIAAGLFQAAERGWAIAVRPGPVLWLTLCGAILIVGIFAVTAMAVDEFRERALINSERELQNTVRLLTRHFDHQFEDSDTIAQDLIAQMKIADFTSPEAFRERLSTPEAHQMLRSRISAASYLGDIAIYDVNGDLINWSGSQPLPKINVSHRAYFQTFKSNAQSEPVLMEAVRSFLIGKWTTVVARRLSGANNVFLGVITRRIDPDSYRKYFSSVVLGSGAAISLFDGNGTMLARYPHMEGHVGRNYANGPLMRKILTEGGQHTMRVESPVDGQNRLGSGSQLSNFPITIIATNTIESALADWHEQTRFLIMTATLSASAIAVILFLIIRQISRQNSEAQQRLEAERLRLDTALNNMSQGLLFYDATGHLVTLNRRYLEIFGLSADIVKPGCHFSDVMHHRKATGTFDGDVDEFCAAVMVGVAEGKQSDKVFESADGRAFQIVNTPLEQGGWIATIEDITERRILKQERDRNYMFLREIIDHIPSQITVKDALTRQYLLVNRVAEEQFAESGSKTIVGKTAFDILQANDAAVVTRDDDRVLQSTDGLVLDEQAWKTRDMGQRYITSKRISIRDRAGEPRYIINVVEDVTDRRRADEKIAHMAHYDALTDLPNRSLFRTQIERELGKVAAASNSPSSISTSTSSRASTTRSATMSATSS